MRYWTHRGHASLRCYPWFSAYLWGIETVTTTRPASRKPRFQPTYEELKLASQSLCGSHAFSLPMRNWNYGRVSLTGYHSPSFSAHLWGIETLRSSGSARLSWGFQPPMRNWTLTGHQHHRPSIRFQPTYEELKRSIELHSTSYFQRFQPTMRNWNRTRQISGTCRGFSLPMRNWNNRCFHFLTSNFNVFSLPMRNWNLPCWTGWL